MFNFFLGRSWFSAFSLFLAGFGPSPWIRTWQHENRCRSDDKSGLSGFERAGVDKCSAQTDELLFLREYGNGLVLCEHFTV